MWDIQKQKFLGVLKIFIFIFLVLCKSLSIICWILYYNKYSKWFHFFHELISWIMMYFMRGWFLKLNLYILAKFQKINSKYSNFISLICGQDLIFSRFTIIMIDYIFLLMTQVLYTTVGRNWIFFSSFLI